MGDRPTAASMRIGDTNIARRLQLTYRSENGRFNLETTVFCSSPTPFHDQPDIFVPLPTRVVKMTRLACCGCSTRYAAEKANRRVLLHYLCSRPCVLFCLYVVVLRSWGSSYGSAKSLDGRVEYCGQRLHKNCLDCKFEWCPTTNPSTLGVSSPVSESLLVSQFEGCPTGALLCCSSSLGTDADITACSVLLQKEQSYVQQNQCGLSFRAGIEVLARCG